MGAIHSTKIPTGPTGKRGPPQKVDPFFRNFSGWTEPIHWVLDRNFRKVWLNGSRPMVPIPEETSLPLKNFVKIKASPSKNSISFYSTPKENLNFYNLPWRVKSVLIRGEGVCGGGTDIKCNSAIASGWGLVVQKSPIVRFDTTPTQPHALHLNSQ